MAVPPAKCAHPRWLLDCKSEIVQADEWKVLTEELNEVIQQQLTESHVSKFTDLSDPEKQLFLDRAAKAIEDGDTFQNFNLVASDTLDKHLSNHANHRLLTTSPLETKSELVLDQAREGVLGLLKSWPGNKAKLHRFFNQSLPDRLRQVTWRLYLRSPKVRSLYLEQLKADPNSVMSILDLEVIQTSEELLMREPTFQELSNNTVILHAMKAILSYHHVCKKTKTSLIDTDYMLVIPFLVNVLSTTRPEHLVLESTVALLIEQYTTFMSSRPIYMRESYVEEFQRSMESFANQTARILQEKDEAMAQHLQQVFSAHFPGLAAVVQGIKPLVRPMVRCLFVGYLSLDAVMYIWDQYIIGLDAPDYDIIPSMTVSILMLLRTHLLQCNSLPELEYKLKKNAVKLTKEELMYQIGHHFYQVLHSQLNSGRGGTLVLDPTQVAMPWEHWHREMLPQRTTAQDRRQERNHRDDQRPERAYPRLGLTPASGFPPSRGRDTERAEERKPRLWEEEDQEQEKQSKAKADRKAQAEIDELKREIERLKQAKPSIKKPEKLEDRPRIGQSGQDFSPRELEDPLAASAVMTDLLKDFVDGARKLQGHGSRRRLPVPVPVKK